jgi:subtilase family serine protease
MGGKVVASNTPSYVSTAKNLGAENPSKVIEVSVWLQLHNRSEFDALAASLYDSTSPNYRHWLKARDITARFAPTAAEAKTVQKFLEAHNLKVVTTGPDNFFVRARGTVGDVENAFQVTLNNYQVKDKVIRANDRDPYVDGDIAPLVQAISGLDSGEFEHPMMARPTNAAQEAPATPDFYSNVCFDGVTTQTYNDPSMQTTGTYRGNFLNAEPLTGWGCGYTPPMIQAAYNLNGLYAEGYNGAGQTIGIIDSCGSTTIQSDANAFSDQFGLPELTASNFVITYITPPVTPEPCEAADQTEINIDVEWAHAIAPGAAISLIVPPSDSFQDMDEGEITAIEYGLGTVLSGSYGAAEPNVSSAELTTESLIQEMAAVKGISANFASGDSGDYTSDQLPATVSAPADSPYATAVGGVTLALNSDNSIAWQAGWGDDNVLLVNGGYVYNPPLNSKEDYDGFQGGSGGGASNCVVQKPNSEWWMPPTCVSGFPKPSYQKKLPGKYRQLPDVSWVADPYTGVAIAVTIPGQEPSPTWQVWGGTSVACPMFSALWAIANQEALAGGGTVLGQAAPYMYSLPAGAVYDIVPVTSKTNVTASIQTSTGTDKYTAEQVIGLPGKYVSAIWDYPLVEDDVVAIVFGMDSSLKTTKGWDNVTGMGTPNAQAFADSFYGK